MRDLKTKANRAPDDRGGGMGPQPIPEEVGWAMSLLPNPNPQPRPNRDLLLLGLAVAVIIVMNFVFWEAGGDLPVINPGTGRQINQSEPWD